MTTNTSDRQLVTALLVILGALLVLPILFMGFGMMGWGSMMGGMWGDGMWGTGTVRTWVVVLSVVIPLLFLLALLGGGSLLYRALTNSDGASDRALEALRTAYARGDLTQEEYERRRETLERDR